MSADAIVQDVVETPPIAEAEFVCQARVPGGICGATERHPANPKNQCVRGHFIPGSQQRLTHGARAFERHGNAALPADTRLSVDDWRAQVFRDRGGIDNLTAIEAAYIRRLADLETVARLIGSNLATDGLFTKHKRVRSALTKWMEVLDRWDKYAQRVGMESRRSTLTLAAQLAQAPVVGGETEDRDAGE